MASLFSSGLARLRQSLACLCSFVNTDYWRLMPTVCGFLIALAGCNRDSGTSGSDSPCKTVPVHNFRSVKVGELYVEAWTPGRAIRPRAPIGLGIRLRRDHGAIEKAQFEARLVCRDSGQGVFDTGKQPFRLARETRESETACIFNSELRLEQIVVPTGSFLVGQLDDILVGTNVKDLDPLAPGSYRLHVIVTVDNSEIHFDDLVIEIV